MLNLQSASDKVLSASVNLKYQAYSLISTILQLENLLGIPYGREINLVGSIDTRFVKVNADELVQKYR